MTRGIEVTGRVNTAGSIRVRSTFTRSYAQHENAPITRSSECFFGTSGEFCLNLQKLYELRRADQKNGAEIARLASLDDSLRLRAPG